MGLRQRWASLGPEQRAELARALPPLPPLQRRLWVASRLADDVPVYNVAEAWRVRGALDPAALRRALDAVYARHNALREVVIDLFEEPRLATLPAGNGFPLAELDLGDVDPGQVDERAERLVHTLSRHEFDLAEGPLVRALLIRRSADDWVFAVVLHHLVCDGDSLGVLLRELSTLYSDPYAALPPAPDALAAQQALGRAVTPAERERDLAYWRENLRGVESRSALPTDFRRPASMRFHGRRIPMSLTEGWYERARTIARRTGSSPFDVLLACLSVVVSRLGSEPDTIIATTVNMRADAAAEDAVGFFMKTVPLRVRVDPAGSGLDLVRLAHDTVLGAMTHTAVEYDDVVTALRDGRDQDVPLARVGMELLYDVEPLRLGGIEIEPVALDTGIARTDLTFYLSPASAADSYLEFSTELYDQGTAEALAAALDVVLTDLHDNPDSPVGALAISDAARAAREPAAEAVSSSDVVLLFDAVRSQARNHPDRLAVVAGERLTYAELVAAADALGTRLRQAGVGRGDRVGVCLRRSADQIVALFGVWAAGGVFVPLDPDAPADRLHRMIRAAGIQVVLVHEDTADSAALTVVQRMSVRQDTTVVAASPQAVHPADLAYVVFTSGTSGDPKPVAVRHDSLAVFGRAMHDLVFHRLSPPARAAVNAPIFFDAALQNVQLLGAGHTVHVVPEASRLDPVAFLDFLVEHDIEVTDCTPTHAAALVDAGLLDDGRTPLRLLVMGGEAVPVELWDRLLAGGLQAFNVYGPTEFTVNATGCPIDRPHPVIGRPLAGSAVEILDERLRPVPAGFPGELYLSGAQLAVGYLGQPGRTAERFVAAPGGSRRYATGDFGRQRADGTIDYLGRVDDQVKLRGYRIELAEVAAVLRAAPGVADAVALVARQPEPTLVAALIPGDGEVSVEAVRAFAAERLPAYMVPAMLQVVDAFPRTPNGKLDAASLIGSVTPTAARPGTATSGSEPVSDVQRRLAAIWCRLLRRPQVHADDDFFAIGGHSLLATWLVREIGSEFGVALPIQVIFAARRLGPMAEALEAGIPRGAAADTGLVVPLSEQGDGLPLVVTHPLGGTLTSYEPLVRLIGATNPVWGIRSPTVAGRGPEPSDVDDLVLGYTDELVKRVTAPAVALFGWSLGGLVSLALAAELEARGVDVAFVEMWDCGLETGNPLGLREMVPMAVHAAYGEQAAAVITPFAQELSADVSSDDRQVRELVELARGADRAFTGTDPFDEHLSVIAHQTALFRTWMPSRVRAPLHVVLAATSLRNGSVHHTDWTPYTAAGWTENVVETDHYGIVRFPAVAEPAGGLLRRLRDRRPAHHTGRPIGTDC